MSDQELGRFDIAQVNQACASALSSTAGSPIPDAALEVDRMAARARAETERHWHRYTSRPEEYNDSLAYFRLLCLVTVLQDDFGVRYHPERAKSNADAVERNETFYADAQTVFLAGLTGAARVGTCASLPVLYVAVGRRLGYPMKLVTTRNHLFARWDDGRERINVEATGVGLSVFDDDYYRRWPFPVSPEEERRERYLVSLSPREELGVFLSLRAHCLAATGRRHEAINVQQEVCRRFPESPTHAGYLRELERTGRIVVSRLEGMDTR
jgi:hypothetical protein